MEARFKHAISNGGTCTLDHSTAFLWNGSVGCTWQCTNHFTSLTLFDFLKNDRILFKNFFIISLKQRPFGWVLECRAQFWPHCLLHSLCSLSMMASCVLLHTGQQMSCFVWGHGAVTTQGTSSGMERSELVRRRMKKRKGLFYCTEQKEP